MKLTIEDFQSLLNLISSDRVTLRGNEALAVAKLQQKLAAAIQAIAQMQDEPAKTPPVSATKVRKECAI